MKKTILTLVTTLALAFTAQAAAEGNLAFKNNLAAAKSGDAKAQTYVAIRYDKGMDGVTQNSTLALKYFIAAAQQGMTGAQALAGARLQAKPNVDLVEAYKWLTLAANGGHANSKVALPKVEQKLSKDQLAEAKKRIAEFKPSGPVKVE